MAGAKMGVGVWRPGSVLTVAALALLAACGGGAGDGEGEETASGPVRFANLGDKVLVRFEDNPDASVEVCQPVVVFAVDRPEEEAFPVQVTFLVNQASFSGAGFALRKEGGEEALSGMMVLNEAGHVQLPCAEIEVQLDQFACKDPETYEPRGCPDLNIEGTDMFAEFHQAP